MIDVQSAPWIVSEWLLLFMVMHGYVSTLHAVCGVLLWGCKHACFYSASPAVHIRVMSVCSLVSMFRCPCDCDFVVVWVYLLLLTCMWVCGCGFEMVCVWMYPFLLVWVVRVLVGGSLVSLLNIKQLEVIKYLGSAGSLWILILPFPSVSQISLSFFFFVLPPPPSLTQPLSATSLSFSRLSLLLWSGLMLQPSPAL